MIGKILPRGVVEWFVTDRKKQMNGEMARQVLGCDVLNIVRGFLDAR